MTIKAYPDQAKSQDGKTQYVTANPVREQQYALDVIAHAFTQRIGTDTAETGSTTRIIKATGHVAIKGDVIGFTAGNLDNSEYRVESVATDYITLSEIMSEAPANGDAFEILRQRSAVLGGDGSLGVSFSNDTDAGNSGANTLRVVIATDQDVIPVSDNGASLTVDAVNLDIRDLTSASDSVAAVQSGTWTVDLSASSTVSVENLPTTVDTNTGAAGASTLRSVLATRHEAVATPLAAQLSNGTAAVAYDSGAAGATVLRTVLATRHEAAATPVATRTGNGTNFDDYNAGAATAATPRMAVAATNLAYTAKGKIAGTALTGSYATLLNPTSDLRIIAIFNSCNDTIMVSLDGGTTDSFELEAGESISLDLAANGLKFDNAVNISAKHAGAAPTLGTVRASGIG